MESLRQNVQAGAKKMKGLGDRSMELTSLVRPINRISEPPHLLALNASRADKLAFIDDLGTLSYGQLEERVRRVAAGLRPAVPACALLPFPPALRWDQRLALKLVKVRVTSFLVAWSCTGGGIMLARPAASGNTALSLASAGATNFIDSLLGLA